MRVAGEHLLASHQSDESAARRAGVEAQRPRASTEISLARGHARSAAATLLAALTFGAGLGAAGCAGEAPGQDASAVAVRPVDTGAAPKIIGGAKDDDAASVMGVVALRVGNGGTFELCSGALIAPNVVLTARHCVTKNVTTSVSCDEHGKSANGEHVEGDEDPATIGIYFGAAPSFADKPAARATHIIGPDTKYLCDADIALVVLDRKITEVEPLPVRLDTGAIEGETIRSVGYGQNDKQLPIGTRFRKDAVTVLAMGSRVSDSKTPLAAREFEVGRSICQGDSGGPAISEETGAVIGVVSRGGGCQEDYGHIYTTTAGWDDLFAQAFALAGGTPIPEGTTAAAPKTSDASEQNADSKIPFPVSEPKRESDSGGACSTSSVGSGVRAGSSLELSFGGMVGLALALARLRRRRA